jgi:hypothetical protein
MGIPSVDVNFFAVFVAALASMIIGSLWYGPIFGKYWVKLSGITKKDLEKAQKRGMWKTYLANFIALIVMAYVLAHIIAYIGATNFYEGSVAGFWVWLGFVAPVMLGMVLWEGKPIQLYLLNVGCHLISLIAMGALIASFG